MCIYTYVNTCIYIYICVYRAFRRSAEEEDMGLDEAPSVFLRTTSPGGVSLSLMSLGYGPYVSQHIAKLITYDINMYIYDVIIPLP